MKQPYFQKEIVQAFRDTFKDKSKPWVNGRLEKFGNILKKVEIVYAGTVVQNNNDNPPTFIKLLTDHTLPELAAANYELLSANEAGSQWVKK